ncbi:MAG: ABC transporter permease [Ruminococcus sp.]|nr:ABC transporter permease [Ruminococcus sp.]
MKEITTQLNGFKTRITAHHRLFDLHLKETFSYRDLIFLFVKRDFVSKYKQTVLGPAWALIQPLLTTVVYTLVFGGLAGLTTADIEGDYIIPGFLFYLSGSICWSYFSGTLLATSGTFLNNSAVMGKVYYPRLVTPISTALAHMISFGIQFAMLVVAWIIYAIIGGTSLAVTPWLLLLPLVVLQMMILSTGFGIIISSITTKYRDLQMLVSFGLQLWQYATPIAYGLTLVSTSETFSKYMFLYQLNPMTPIVTTFRYAMFGFGYFDLTYYLISWAVTIVVFIVGLVLFSRIERTFMDTI